MQLSKLLCIYTYYIYFIYIFIHGMTLHFNKHAAESR